MENNRTDSVLEFPCEFAIKVMGKATERFETAVYNIIKQNVNELKENAITTRPSGKGNYLAITVTIEAQSQDQLDTIYQQFTACDQVLMAL
jgi:putative lipoic acid-binding regulatory protein